MPSTPDELERGWALVSPEWSGLDVVRRDPNPTPDQLGAVAGFGIAVAATELQGAVYVFDSWAGGLEVGERLESMVDGDRYHAASAVNGALLMFAATPATPTGRDCLDRLLGAFHGLE